MRYNLHIMCKINLADPAVFARAYRDHRDLAFTAANAVLRDAGAAEDVVQDVFLRIWSRPRSFDPSRGSLATYIAVMARSRAVDQWRSRQTRAAALERAAAAEEAPIAQDSTADRVIRSDLRGRALRAIDRLPAPQRDALLLSYAKDLPVAEVAGLTGAPLGTAKGRVRLGLRRTRMLLETAA